MPIGRRPPINRTFGTFIPDATASGNLRAGAAVALVSVSGQARIIECGANTSGRSFLGFAPVEVLDGDPVPVVTLRGSTVTPILEGGGNLTPGGALFLSNTEGEVIHTIPPSGTVIRVGDAFTTTMMTINTDHRVVVSP